MVYVDDAEVPKHGRTWFHLVADSIQELHTFAADIGLDSRAFHRVARHPHYDIMGHQRLRALRFGARPITAREAVLIGRNLALDVPRPASRDPQLSLFA